ncbi:MAG TPA: F0F1 ATP synthase subunit epsilon [Flavobacterium sp.]|nr:F0F1 ATP synthase subunit epsilon [Flavobacterium sp.]
MILEIVSPEASLFKGEVTSVTVPGTEGEFQMLNNHAAIVSTLGKGNVKFEGVDIKFAKDVANKFRIENNKYILPINSGTLEMKNNKAIVLID